MEIHISKEKEPIEGSPLIVHAFDPTAVNVLDFPDQIIMNTTNRFVLDPTKAGKGSLKIAIRGMPLILSSESSWIFLRCKQSISINQCSQTFEWPSDRRV